MPFLAACLQLNSSTDVAENIATVERLARDAAAGGAHYIQTPEMTNIVQKNRRSLAAAIFPESEDPSLAAFSALAAELQVNLHVGSLALDAGEGKIANRGFLIRPDGAIAARYDKIHLYDVDLPGGESWRESKVYTGGDRAEVADLADTKIGLAICYDVRFPALYRALSHAGAEILTAPSAFTRQTGEAHWHVLQRARAIENGAYMISAAQTGAHDDGRETYGHSLIVNPWGEIIADAGAQPDTVILAEIDPESAHDARRRIPVLANERAFAPPDAGSDTTQLRSVS